MNAVLKIQLAIREEVREKKVKGASDIRLLCYIIYISITMKGYEKPFFKVSLAPSISYYPFIKEVTHEINFFKNNPRLKV